MKTRKILNEGYKMLMNRHLKFLVLSLFVLAYVEQAAAQVDSGLISNTIYNAVWPIICTHIFDLIAGIATAVASLVTVLAGIKWVASENDPGARKQAKDVFVHAMVGLILIVVGMYVLDQAFSTVLTGVIC